MTGLRSKNQALYQRIEQEYREKILSGELENGSRIESELEIQKIYGVSRITARQAIQRLEQDGLVKRQAGRGTFVQFDPQSSGQENASAPAESFEAEMIRRGEPYECSVESLEEEMLPEKLQKIFGKLEPSSATCMRRTFLYGSEPVACTVTWIDPVKPEISPDEVETLMSQAKKVRQEFSAILASEKICRILQIGREQPVLCRSRILYNEKNQAYIYTETYCRGDKYTYRHHMEL